MTVSPQNYASSHGGHHLLSAALHAQVVRPILVDMGGAYPVAILSSLAAMTNYGSVGSLLDRRGVEPLMFTNSNWGFLQVISGIGGHRQQGAIPSYLLPVSPMKPGTASGLIISNVGQDCGSSAAVQPSAKWLPQRFAQCRVQYALPENELTYREDATLKAHIYHDSKDWFILS